MPKEWPVLSNFTRTRIWFLRERHKDSYFLTQVTSKMGYQNLTLNPNWKLQRKWRKGQNRTLLEHDENEATFSWDLLLGPGDIDKIGSYLTKELRNRNKKKWARPPWAFHQIIDSSWRVVQTVLGTECRPLQVFNNRLELSL